MNRVECGDSLYHLRKIPDGEAGAIVSDPPFFIGIGRDEGGQGSDPWTPEVTSSVTAVDWARPFAKEFVERSDREGRSC